MSTNSTSNDFESLTPLTTEIDLSRVAEMESKARVAAPLSGSGGAAGTSLLSPTDLFARERSLVLGVDSSREEALLASESAHWFSPAIIKEKARYNFLAQLASINVMQEVRLLYLDTGLLMRSLL